MWRAGAGDKQNLSHNAMSAVYPAQTTSLRIIALTSSMNISWGHANVGSVSAVI